MGKSAEIVSRRPTLLSWKNAYFPTRSSMLVTGRFWVVNLCLECICSLCRVFFFFLFFFSFFPLKAHQATCPCFLDRKLKVRTPNMAWRVLNFWPCCFSVAVLNVLVAVLMMMLLLKCITLQVRDHLIQGPRLETPGHLTSQSGASQTRDLRWRTSGQVLQVKDLRPEAPSQGPLGSGTTFERPCFVSWVTCTRFVIDNAPVPVFECILFPLFAHMSVL